MPKNLKRYYGSGDLHFITCSCYHRQPLLGTPHLRDLFLKALEQMRTRYRFVVLGCVVMPEHFHLLISEPQQGTPSTVMQAIKLGFARRVIGSGGAPCLADFARHGDSNRIWERRFYDFNVWTERKRIEKLRYTHRNPVKRGLVQEPDQWPWSSFRSYVYGEARSVVVNEWRILQMRIRLPAA